MSADPDTIDALGRLADALERSNELAEQGLALSREARVAFDIRASEAKVSEAAAARDRRKQFELLSEQAVRQARRDTKLEAEVARLAKRDKEFSAMLAKVNSRSEELHELGMAKVGLRAPSTVPESWSDERDDD